jgi:hypothetical protein
MTYSIDEYLSDIPLQSGKKVEMTLLAEQMANDEEKKQVHLRPCAYDISLVIIVDGEQYSPIPLARVMKANRNGVAYGEKEEELSGVSEVVKGLDFSKGAVLDGFFKVPSLGLEQAMSSDSILYAYKGMIEYAQAVGRKIGLEKEKRMILGNKEVGSKEVTRLYDAAKKTSFLGYKDRFIQDSLLFERN